MEKMRDNPFQFGAPVSGDYYLPRPPLARLVTQFLDHRVHVVLQGPRRFGKTSFVLRLLEGIERSGKTTLFVDIFNITSHRDFLNQVLRALKAKRGFSQKLTEWLKQVPRLRPRLGYDLDPNTGKASYSLSAKLVEEGDVKETIQDVLGSIQRLGKQVVFAIDEFQKIAEIDDGGWLEGTLRTQMQQTKNVAFLFTGSRKSLISDLLNNQSRPFYRSCQMIDFPPFGEEFNEWVVKRFKAVGVQCDRAAIQKLSQEVQSTPNYIQQACFHLVAEGHRKVGAREIDKVLGTIVRQNSYAYQTLLNSFTLPQQRALRLAAIEDSQLFAKTLLLQYEIPSAAALASAIKALKDREIVDEGSTKGRVVFDDPLFAIWLRTEFSVK